MATQKDKIEPVKTLTVNNFNGDLTRFRNGDINSGKAYYDTSWGYNPYTYPVGLMFIQEPVSIKGSVVTDLILAGKTRIENGITYVYALGHLGRIYKIQVNDPATKNCDYDTPVLLATLSNSQTFNYGGSLGFFQSSISEKIWIGHDSGMTKINFDGTGETNLVNVGWVSNVPRVQNPSNAKLYVTNGPNIAAINSSETVDTYTVINPGFPLNYQARDMDVTADGRYTVITITRSSQGSVLQTVPSLNDLVSDSIIGYWNGTDPAVSSYNSTPNFVQTCYHTFGQNEYVFGYDVTGSILSDPKHKIFTLLWAQAPLTTGVSSTGDFIGWVQPEGNNGNNSTTQTGNFMIYGTLDAENKKGLYRSVRVNSTLTNGDIVRCPFMNLVSTEQFSGPSSGYSITPLGVYNIATGKTYFSTLEYDGVNTAYNLYSFKNALDGLSPSCGGYYDTQVQILSDKVKITEIRVYFDPAQGNEQFTTSILGSNGFPIAGSSNTFTPSAGEDRLKYNPSMAPTYSIGLRIQNTAGTGFIIIKKVEIDYVSAGN